MASVRRIRAVVFDLFGTLVPEFPLPVWLGMFEGMAGALGTDAGAFQPAWEDTVLERQTGGFADVGANLREICRRLGRTPSDAQIADALEVRDALYRTWFRPQPGAVETLGWLRERGYRTALVSMCAPDAPALWAASPLGGLVDVLVFSCEVGLRKPDPAIYLAATDRLGLAPAGCLYVGDGSYRELTGAEAVGMTPVRIVDPAEEAEMLRPDRDDWVGREIRSLDEVPEVLEGSRAR
ncbi:MAG TPA: HAD-IA family hydrolase [Actinomycetota bacterium]|nr:HAD-IA family hydrolase [Actinomycetota bacterium]